MKKQVLILFLGLFCLGNIFAQSETVAEFQKDANGYKAYLYQSVLRMLNKDKNPDFNRLIRDLDHLRLATTDSIGDAAQDVLKKLDAGVIAEGFEEMVTYESKESVLHLYELESGRGKSSWIATFITDGMAGVFEMKGSLNLKYLNAFESLNTERLQEFVDFD